MDAKDLRIEPALSERNNDASKYAQSGTALQSNRNKSYQDIGSNPSAKVDAATVRPCAVIGPDRVVPPNDHNDAYLKKASVEPWPCSDSQYHRPPDYPLKAAAAVYHNPTRNISPRQTFQENMQRIMVPPTYNSAKVNDDASFIQKLNGTSDAKYCDVPYTVNPITNDPKNIRSVEMCLPSVNPALGRPAPHGWPPGGINVRPQRPYVPSEMYQFPEYPSCAGPRPVSISRPHRTIPEESAYMYPETYYQEPNIRFKPYPNVKDRYPQQRYDYIANYSNPFHPSCPPQKYEIPKSLPPHPYSTYPHFKYVDSRMPEPLIEGYQRPGGQQGSYNIQYRNQIVHPTYGPVMSNNSQSKIPPYPPDGSFKSMASNKLPYDGNSKIYVEYDNARMKSFAPSETYYSNEIHRHHAIPKGAMPNYQSINVQSIPPNSYYKKENLQMKNYEYINHLKNVNPSINMNNIMQRHMPQFSPNTLAISPTDSNTSNDTSQTHSTSQEDCGYVSQSSTTSIRSTEIGHNKIPNDYYGRYYDPKYGPIIRTGPTLTKLNRSGNSTSIENKDKKEMDVRKFLQMWNEGDEDNAENSSNKEIVVQANSNELSNISKQHGAINNQEQLYVLGLVNVPSEDLSKYEHIQKVSKLPENIKGYNSIELLNQFEEVIESSNLNSFKLSTPKDFQSSHKPCTPKQTINSQIFLPRPISPLDVEAKISQSVIHKEVGCNFEIKPCSPKMLNVEIAAPVQNILNERVIEKVTNPLSMIASPILNRMGDNTEHCKISSIGQDQRMLEESEEISSCKMINTPFSNTDTNSIKTNYSIQDFETNAGVCLASLPRLDNDIELHFPEVNQQFINANKGEPVMLNQIKDLPELKVVDHSDKVLRNIKPDSNELSPKVETEREFTKLSKYRKTKTNGTDGRQDKLAPKAAAFRTDSVIIKNPENVKASEINKEQSNTNKTFEVNHLNTVNLSSQVHSVVDAVPDTNIQTEINFSNTSLNASEEAIDFRLNKDVANFEINNSIEEGCAPVQLNKEEDKLTKSMLCENTNDVIQSLETNEDITSNIMSNRMDVEHGMLSAEKDPKNDILASTMLFQSPSCASNPTIEKSFSSDTIDVLDKSADLPNVNSRMTEEINVNENEKLQITNKNDNKTLEVTMSDKDSVVKPKVDNSPKRKIDIDDKSNIHSLMISDITFEECNINQPKDDNLNILSSVESPKIDLCPDESDIQQKEVTEKIIHKKLISAVLTVSTNGQKSDDSIHDDIMDVRSAIINEQRENKEDSVLHSENVFCDSKYHAKVTDSCNTDEGFVSIEEKQNSDQEMPIFLNESDSFKSVKNLELTKHFNKCFGYGSKELYSPWIQNLIMFNEGLCRALSSEDIKPSPHTFINTLDNSQLEDIASGDDCTVETVNTTNDFNSIDYNIVGDASLQSKNDILTDTNAILSSIDSEHLNDHLEDNHGNNSIQDSPQQVIELNDRNSNLEINNEMVLPNTVEESLEPSQAEPDVNICIDLISQNDPEKTKTDSMTEVLNYKHDVNMDIEITSEIPPNITTDKTIKESLVNEPHIDSSNDTQCEILNKTTKDNEIKKVLLDEHDENAKNNIISETQYEEIQERLLDEQDGITCIDSMSNAANCEVNAETLSSIETENSKQFKHIQQERKNKKEESAYKINMIANNHIKPKNRKSLKRSLSDSALNILHSEQEREEISVIWPFKRSKLNTDNIDESDIIAQNLCNILQHNRRNSISAVYNEDNVSFCILIEDNTIITEDNEDSGKICYTEISEDCLNETDNTYGCENVDVTIENTDCNEEINDNNEEITENQNCDYSDSITLHDEDDISLHRTWVEDVACVETVVSDDIAEDIVISSASTPKEIHFWDNVDSNYYENSDKEDDIVTSSPRFGDGVSLSGPKFHEISESPEIDDSEVLISNHIEMCQGIYDNESLEKILSESNSQAETHSEETTCVVSETLKTKTDEKENVNFDVILESNTNTKYSSAVHEVENKIDQDNTNSQKFEKMQDGTVHSCESSIDNVFSYKHRDESTNYATSSSPEVSSTTSEEKSSGIFLKITNYNGSKVSQINRFNTNSNNRISCKFTEKTDYANATHHPNRPLITKAAQKYIPPIKETIHDLKVKLSLPPHSLLKLKQMKTSKDEPKRFKQSSHPSILPKKPKPKFEDVLKSIDEIQIKMHKEKNKKVRKTIPKVVIKKNENGSHYASTSNKDSFNPDLTGRKWQPWVFLEKNNFIDKMATRRKTKAIFNHRKNAYVLAEKFHKYKSASSTKFVISQPKLSESSTGQLKYTIRLKHSY